MVALNTPATNQKHYTCGQVATAFQDYFRKLQVKGVLDLPKNMAERKLSLEEQIERLKIENDLLKHERALLRETVGAKTKAA